MDGQVLPLLDQTLGRDDDLLADLSQFTIALAVVLKDGGGEKRKRNERQPGERTNEGRQRGTHVQEPSRTQEERAFEAELALFEVDDREIFEAEHWE